MLNDLQRRIEEAVKFIINLNPDDLKCEKYVVDDKFFYLVQEYQTKKSEEGRHEGHKKYVDIQYMAEGTECIEVTAAAFMEIDEPYNPETDIVFFKEPKQAKSVVLTPGKYEIFYPRDSHKPGLIMGESQKVKKILGKILI